MTSLVSIQYEDNQILSPSYLKVGQYYTVRRTSTNPHSGEGYESEYYGKLVKIDWENGIFTLEGYFVEGERNFTFYDTHLAPKQVAVETRYAATLADLIPHDEWDDSGRHVILARNPEA